MVLYVAWELGMCPPWGKGTVEELLKTKSLKQCLHLLHLSALSQWRCWRT